MTRLLFVVLLLIIAFTINADHMDAYKYDGKNNQLKTISGYYMFNMRKGNNIMWYYNSNDREPECKFNTLNLNIDYLDVMKISGDEFDSKICIKAYSTLWYFDMIDTHASGEESRCQWTNYVINSNNNILNVNASCNRQGCLTKYGWVKNQYIY